MEDLLITRYLYGDSYQIDHLVEQKKEELYQSCNLSPNASSEIFTAMACEISSSERKPGAQYCADLISRRDVSSDPSFRQKAVELYCHSLRKIYKPLPQQFDCALFEADRNTIDRIFAMALDIFAWTKQYMNTIHPSASAQHVTTFKLSPANNNGAEEEKDDETEAKIMDDGQSDDDEDDDEDDDGYGAKLDMFYRNKPPSVQPHGVTTHILADDDNNPFRRHNNGPFKQRECRSDHILVDLQQNTYQKYPVTSIIAPYGIIECKQRGYMLQKAADLYGVIANSIQFIYTSMMGMVFVDAVVTTNNGSKLGKRIMNVAELVSFVSVCFGLSQRTMNWYKVNIEAKCNLYGIQIQTDWDYIKFVAAKYRENVSESFRTLVVMKPDEIDINILLQIIGVSDDDMKTDYYKLMLLDHILQGLDVIEVQQANLLRNFDEWVASRSNDQTDPYMQIFGHPDDEDGEDVVEDEDGEESMEESVGGGRVVDTAVNDNDGGEVMEDD